MDTCIKNIDEEAWRYFKIEATRHDMALGEFFGRLLKDHLEKEEKSNWDEILGRKPILTADEARAIKNAASDFRKRFKFR